MGPSIRVLCVDDDPSIVELVARYLQEDYDDITPVPETDPEDALERVRFEAIDCVVSDYQMPGMDGLELLDEVRALEPELPFVLFTGRGSETVASKAVSAGVTDYIRKTTGTEQYDLLVNRVRNAVGRYRARLDYRTIFDGVTDAILVIDPDTRDIVDVNSAFCDQWGYDETTALSLSPDDLAVANDVGERFCRATGETLDVECVTGDGDRFWAAVKIKRADISGTERVLAIVRDVTERHEREVALSALVRAEQNLLAAESRAEICETAVDLATEAFRFDAAQMLVRDGTEQLQSMAAVGPAPFDDEVFATARRQVAADALESGELKHQVLTSVGRYPDGFSLHSEVRVPVGDEGVLVGNTSAEVELGSYERDLVRVLTTNVATALDRADREELLREREGELQRQRDELASLNHTNEVIRTINQALVEVSSRDEIERVVCEQLAAADQYRLAWIGDYDLMGREITPNVWAGIENGDLQGLTISIDEDRTSAFETAVEDRTIAIAEQSPAATDANTQYDGAREREKRPAAVIPLHYHGKFYNVLTVRAEESNVFGETEQTVLSELGETIGYAMHAVEQRQALLADSITELEFELQANESLLSKLSKAADRRVEVDGIVGQSDGSLRLFVTAEGELADGDWADMNEHIKDHAVITETETTTLYEITVDQTPAADVLADHGAELRTASAEDGTIHFVVHLPSHVDATVLVDQLKETYSNVDLLAQREQSYRRQSTPEFKASLQADLTDRQHEVLQAAHHAGFFEWPRVTSGDELATALGISQSTFHEHLRAGEQKLFRRLFDEDKTIPV